MAKNAKDNMELKPLSLSVTTNLPLTGQFRAPQSERDPVLLLLHGYQETGSIIYEQLISYIPATWGVLSFNGIFPLPRWKKLEPPAQSFYEMRYGWYFFDPYQRTYHVEYGTPAAAIVHGLEQLGLRDRITHIMGYSQGGYLAPFVGERLPNVQQVLVLAASYMHAKLGPKLSFRLDGLHGALDDRVEPDKAQENYRLLKAKYGVEGELTMLAQSGHELDLEFYAEIIRRLQGHA